MALSNQQVFDYFLKNPNLNDTQILAFMRQNAVSPSQVASTFNMPIGDIVSRLGAVIPQNEAVLLGDTFVQANYRTSGSGETLETGPLESINVYKTTGGINDKITEGTDIQNYSPTGEFIQTTKMGKDLSFFGGIKQALKDPYVLGALALATAGATGLLSGGAATTAGTAAELAQANMALGGVGGTVGATELAGALATGAPTVATTALTGGSGLITGVNAGITAESVAAKLAADAAASGSTGLLTGATTGLTTGATTGATTAATTGATTGATTAATTGATTAATTGATTAATTGATTGALTGATTAATTLTATELANAAKLGLTAAQYAQLFTSTAQTAAGLLQQQTSKEAAQKAQAMIDAETTAAKAAAQFRPIGMTTRFGSSQFQRDPVTGQLTSAGYTLSPEAKAAQDRFVKLAEQGIQQAEGAQAQFAPLQTGAQSLFTLGQGYLAKTPESVAQNYLNQQMALLQPGRELELANLQNRLQQQGRGGLSVAQGGAMGATTPELQALYNARAQQEAQLAANAQRAGQQDVLFGAGLLGQGSQAMGQYYSGQQAAYAPYTTALGQVQGLEQLAQQPLQLGANLGQTAAQAGFNVGQLGLRGAGASVELATGKAATTNPYSTAISGLTANPAFGQYVGGLFSGVPATTAMSALPTTFGTGSYYGSQDLGLFL